MKYNYNNLKVFLTKFETASLLKIISEEIHDQNQYYYFLNYFIFLKHSFCQRKSSKTWIYIKFYDQNVFSWLTDAKYQFLAQFDTRKVQTEEVILQRLC
jgi:hypothetical protein